MVSTAYVILVLAVALQRMLEVRVSRANEATLKAHGGVEHAKEQMPWMVGVHTAWLLSSLLEPLLLDRRPRPALLFVALIVFCVGQGLRLLAMHALGRRWTVKVITLPRAPSVDHGVFRYLRHPNYLGVILEIAALPLIHAAYLSAIVFTVANALLLRLRIRAEEQALRASGDYDARLGSQPRLFPHLAQALRGLRKAPSGSR
jgi:methyltransferase